MSHNAEHFSLVRALFDRVVELPADEQTRILADSAIDDSVRTDVLRLLGHLSDASFLTQQPILAKHTSHDSLVGSQVGAFRIIRRIGVGGMGMVYEAEQDQPRRRVALKLIRPEAFSEESLARFRREAELLGRLQHPGIAAVYAAGVATHPHDPTVFLPFCALELIEGEALTAWVERSQLPLDERLELMARVCDAVDHAHRRGVVHRDLKAANILVTADGDPKVLDFGIARALDAAPHESLHTSHGDVLGTLGMMSPEQLRGDQSIDGRSDVYALGALAYEVLSGRPAFDVRGMGIAEAVKHLLEQEPTPVARIRRDLQGDPSLIISTAMAKEAGRRYATAAAMSSDLRACRDRRPIAARPPGLWYIVKRFVQRHRAASAAAALCLVTMVVAMTWITIAYQNERAASERSRRANASLLGMLEWLDPAKTGPQADLHRTLQEAERLTASFDADPEVALTMRSAIAERYARLGEFAKAIEHYGASLTLAEALHGESSEEVATCLTNYGSALRRAERNDEAVEALRRAIAIRRAAPHDHPEHLAESLNGLGAAEFGRGNFIKARELFQESLDIVRALPHIDPIHLSTPLLNMGMTEMSLGRSQHAIPYLDQCLALRAQSGDELELAEACTAAGTAMLHAGDPKRAIELLRRSYEIRLSTLPIGHELLHIARENLARALASHNELEEAEQLMNEQTEAYARAGRTRTSDARALVAQMLITRYRARGDEAAVQRVETSLAAIKAEPKAEARPDSTPQDR